MNPSSRFVRVQCRDCGSEQVVFGKASTAVKCLVCEKQVTVPGGGKCKIKGKVLEVLS